MSLCCCGWNVSVTVGTVGSCVGNDGVASLSEDTCTYKYIVTSHVKEDTKIPQQNDLLNLILLNILCYFHFFCNHFTNHSTALLLLFGSTDFTNKITFFCGWSQPRWDLMKTHVFEP